MLKAPHVNFTDRSFEPYPPGTQVNRIMMTQQATQPVGGGYEGPVGVKTVRLRPEAIRYRTERRSTCAGCDEDAQELERFPRAPTVNPDRYSLDEDFELAQRIDCDRRGRGRGVIQTKRLHGNLRVTMFARL
jgi:hypothetical protein